MGNPLSRFFELIRNPSYSRTTTLLVILTIALSIPLTVFVAQQQQETRQQAAGCTTAIVTKSLGVFCQNISDSTETATDIINTSCTKLSQPQSGCGTAQAYSCKIASCSKVAQTPTPSPTASLEDQQCAAKGGVCQSTCGSNYEPVKNATCSSGKTCCAKKISSPAPDKCPSGNGWTGESCNQGAKDQFDKGSCKPGKCLVTACFKNPGPNNYCWFKQPGNICASTPQNGAECNNPALATLPCDVKSGVGTCIPKTNKCNGEGQQTVNYLTRTDGATCVERRGVTEDCTLASKVDNCSTGKTCVNNQCVTQTTSSTACTPGRQRNRCVTGGCTSSTLPDKQLRDTCQSDGTWKQDNFFQCVTSCSGASDTTPPDRSNGEPSGTLAAGTTRTTISLQTNEKATCKFGRSSATYANLPDTFSANSAGTSHSDTITGLDDGDRRTYYVRCRDEAGNVNTDNFTIAVRVGSSQDTTDSENTSLSFTIGLNGLGTAGDRVRPNDHSSSNKNPARQSRSVTFEVLDEGIGQKTGSLSYNSNLGIFTGTIDLGQSLTSGSYSVRVKVQGYLSKIIAGATLTDNVSVLALIRANLITGDINNDNFINILDYNILSSCIFKPATGNCQNSDLDDNGEVNEFDYNLFLREFPAGEGE